MVADLAPTRTDPDTIVDLAWALSGPETYRALVMERGWTTERYLALMDGVIARVGLEV